MKQRINLKNIQIEKLIPYDKNYLDHSKNLEHIKNSLGTFGYVKTSIVVNEDMVLLCGHGTLSAAKALGWKEIPEVLQVVGLNEKEQMAIRIADNTSAKAAELIMDNLQFELAAIGDDYAMDDFGLDLNFMLSKQSLDETNEPEARTEKKMKEIICPNCKHQFIDKK